ncbi:MULTISPECIES: aldo/keto reductase [unclassified Sinorhizobium]|uniref:aldo/keto reductase n=1 Tax=unclassified Sinorhizobium TaxID=2613772 RepID=UPI0035254984
MQQRAYVLGRSSIPLRPWIAARHQVIGPSMRQRRIGATDLSISEIGFGCGGNAGLMVSGEAAEQVRVIAQALERGITYFDNAPDYGDGKAEENLGLALKELGARPVITTKVEIRAENLEDISNHIVRSVEDSLRRLQVDTIDILQIHNGPVAQPRVMEGAYYGTLWLEDYLRPGGAIEGVRRILESGKARHAGFICRGNDSSEVGTLLKTGLFHLINLPYTLLNPTAGRFGPCPRPAPDYGNVIGAAQAAGAGIAVFSPLAGGLLTDNLVAGQQTHPLARRKDIGKLEAKGELARARRFQEIAQANDMRLAELAYRFILSDSGVSTLIGGFSAADQINVAAAASSAGPLDAAQFAAIEKIWSRFE